MVDRHQPFSPENACGRGRLFRKQRNRHAAGRLTIRTFQNGTVHRQAYRIEWAVSRGNFPPVAVPQRISAVEQAVFAVAQRPGDLHVSDPVDGVRGGCAQRTNLEGIADGSTDYSVEAAIFGKEDAFLRESALVNKLPPLQLESRKAEHDHAGGEHREHPSRLVYFQMVQAPAHDKRQDGTADAAGGDQNAGCRFFAALQQLARKYERNRKDPRHEQPKQQDDRESRPYLAHQREHDQQHQGDEAAEQHVDPIMDLFGDDAGKDPADGHRDPEAERRLLLTRYGSGRPFGAQHGIDFTEGSFRPEQQRDEGDQRNDEERKPPPSFRNEAACDQRHDHGPDPEKDLQAAHRHSGFIGNRRNNNGPDHRFDHAETKACAHGNGVQPFPRRQQGIDQLGGRKQADGDQQTAPFTKTAVQPRRYEHTGQKTGELGEDQRPAFAVFAVIMLQQHGKDRSQHDMRQADQKIG
ncbi:hypothetical protein BGX30_011672 [Mortierella sp. GBA39]|nr:hypothetical protein BGX30_011672 [Mortierella sp. GBA39]